MKRFITCFLTAVLLIGLVGGCARSVETANDAGEAEDSVLVEEVSETDETSETDIGITISENGKKWMDEYLLNTYSNPNMGFEFKYIDGQVKTETENAGLDAGKKLELSTSGISMSFTSADYGIGVGEGCCDSFSSASIDLSKSDAELKTILEAELGDIFDLRRVTVGGKEGLYFYRLYTYINSRLAKSVLIPWNDGVYTNLLITSRVIKDFEGDYDTEVLPAVEEFLSTQELVFEGDIEDSWEIFDPTLYTLKFSGE